MFTEHCSSKLWFLWAQQSNLWEENGWGFQKLNCVLREWNLEPRPFWYHTQPKRYIQEVLKIDRITKYVSIVSFFNIDENDTSCSMTPLQSYWSI